MWLSSRGRTLAMSARIALIGSCSDYGLERFYRDGLQQLGHEVVVFDPEASIPALLNKRVVARLTWRLRPRIVGRALLELFQRDARWDAVVVMKGLMLPAATIARCRQLTPRTVWANINPDNPWSANLAASSPHVRAAIPHYDRYFIWSEALAHPLRAAGARAVSYLPFGFAADRHHPAEELELGLARVVTFVGTYDRERAAVLEGLADLPLRIYGGHWDRLPPWSRLRRCIAGGLVLDEALRRVTSSSLACINLMRTQNAGAHNMRTFEVPAMRGLLLTTRSAEQQRFFPDGSASLMFSTPHELRAQIEGLRAGRYDVERMRERALALSRGHSYAERARMLADQLLSTPLQTHRPLPVPRATEG
jgi:hypothetical protein